MRPTDFINMAKDLAGGKPNEIELPVPQNWYDTLLNGINRTGRPLLLVGVVLFFMWGIVDTDRFVAVMKAYKETPEWVASAILMVIGIFGSGRIIGDIRKKTTLKQSISTTVETGIENDIPYTNERRFNNLNPDDPDVLDAEEDILSSEPENSAIEAWKQKNAN